MKTAPWIIIVCLLLVILFMRECQKPPAVMDCGDCPDSVSFLPGDPYPVRYDSIIYRDTTIYKDSIVYQSVPENIDSGKIARLYFAERFSNRVLVDDTSLYFAVEYMTTQNRVQWFIPTYQNRRERQVNYYYIAPKQDPTNKVFAGLGIGRSPTSFGLSPAVALLTKKDHLYQVQYDVLNRDTYFTIFWKISFKKKK